MVQKRGTKRRGRDCYVRLLEQREREGLTYPELSKRSGVPPSTLQRWGRRLRPVAESPAEPFVELVAEEAQESARVEVVLRSGHTLFLEPGPPSAGLAELVTLLESC